MMAMLKIGFGAGRLRDTAGSAAGAGMGAAGVGAGAGVWFGSAPGGVLLKAMGCPVSCLEWAQTVREGANVRHLQFTAPHSATGRREHESQPCAPASQESTGARRRLAAAEDRRADSRAGQPTGG